MSESIQALTGQELLAKITEFGLNAILESKSMTLEDSVKNDVLIEINTNLINEESVKFAENVINNIEALAQNFKAVPREKRQMIGYLFEHLDLPRITSEVAGVSDLLNALKRANDAGHRSTVTPAGAFSFDNIGNNGIIYTGQDEDARTIPYIRVSEQNVIVFEVSRTDISAYHTMIADGNFVISKLNAYSIDNLLSDLNSIDNVDYRPKLISDRETVSIDNIVPADLDAELQANLEQYQNASGGKLLMDAVIAKKAEELGIDLSDKRVDLADAESLFNHAHEIVAQSMPAAEVTKVEAVVEEPQEQPHGSLPPTVIVETSNSNPAITDEDLFGEESAPTRFEDNIAKAINAVRDNIPGISSAIDANKDNIKDTVTNYVIGYLSPIEQRTNNYTPFEIETIKNEVNKQLPGILKLVDAYKAQVAQEDEKKRLHYTTSLVNEVIDDSRLHSSFIAKLGINRSTLVSNLTDYLNDNKREVGLSVSNQKTIISNILDVIGMYEYNLEVLGNDEFRTLNAPTSNIISSTKLLQRAVVLNYTMVNDIQNKELIVDGLAGVKSGINLSGEVVRAIMSNLNTNQMFKLDTPNNTYVLRGADKTLPVSGDDETAELKVVSKLIIMRSDSANILQINNDGVNFDVTTAITIADNAQRMQLLNAIVSA
jgi:hypothetical protein